MLTVGVQSARWYSDEDPEGSLRFIRSCGFDRMDFNLDMKLPTQQIRSGVLSSRFFDQSVEAICAYYRPLREAIDRTGVSLSQMHAPYPLYIEGQEALNDYLIMVVEKTLALCRYLDCPAVVVHPVGHPEKPRERALNLAMYRRMIPAWQKYGGKLCLENIFGHEKERGVQGRCSEAEEVCDYIDTLNGEAGGDAFGFCLDVGHANLTGQDLRVYLNKLGRRLTILHLHENDGQTDLHRLPYTHPAGPNWENFCAGLRDIGYSGTLNFETCMVLSCMPRAVWPEMLRTISAIGRYWAARIESGAAR